MAILIIALLISPVLFYGIRHLSDQQKQKEKYRQLANAYERLLLQHQLIAERYEVLGSSVLVLDRRHAQLAMVALKANNTEQHTIALEAITEATVVAVRDQQGSIQEIKLRIFRKHGAMAFDICFFDPACHTATELPQQVKQAYHWKHRIDHYRNSDVSSANQSVGKPPVV